MADDSRQEHALLGTLLALDAEAEGRSPRPLRPRVVHLDAAELPAESEILAAGAVTTIVVAPASPIYEQAIGNEDDASRLSELASEAYDAFLGALAEGGDRSAAPAHIIELRYGGKALGTKFPLAEQDAYADAFPYSGGRLEGAQFECLDFPADDAGDPPAVVVVVAMPPLQEVERRALQLAPASHPAVHVSAEPLLIPTTAAATAMATRMAFHAAARQAANQAARHAAQQAARQRVRGGPFFRALGAQPEGEPEANLGPEPTVGELLRRRRDMLERRRSS